MRWAVLAVTRRWQKSVLTLLALAAGVAAVTATLGLAHSSATAIAERFSAGESNRVTVIVPRELPDAFDRSLRLMELLGVSAAGLFAPTTGQNPVDLVSRWDGASIPAPVTIADSAGLRAHGVRVLQGAVPTPEQWARDPDQVVLGSLVARDAGLTAAPGAGTALIQGRRVTVAAVVDDRGNEVVASLSLTLSPATASSLGLLPAQATYVVQGAPGRTLGVASALPVHLEPSDPAAIGVGVPARATTLRGDISSASLTLVLVLSMVTLAASCLGIASTMMSGVWERRSEIGIRLAMGSSRARVAQQFLVESVILGGIGGLLGWGGGVLVAALVVTASGAAFTFPAIGFLIPAAGLVAGLVGGVAPAWATTRVQPTELLSS